MLTHTYFNLHYACLHLIEFVTASGKRIHSATLTAFYEDVVWC
jgi:hypothetical protein